MRVLHVPYTFYPDPAGGTEVYVASLAECQRTLGCEPAVAAPANAAARYDHSGIPVWRFPVSPDLDLRELYGAGDEVAAHAFGAILDEFAPDVVHLHAVTSAVSVRLAEEAASRGIPIILNYHTPTVSCSRGTLLKWGSEICDGYLDRHTCAACTLHAHGLARPLASAVASLPSAVSRALGNAGLSGGFWTALRMSELIDLRIKAFHRLLKLVDHVIALCDWSRRLLIQNGVPEDKIKLCRQGISWQSDGSWADRPKRPFRPPLRAVFLGRLDPTKGAHVVVQALRNNADLPVHLDLFGVSQGESGNRYAADLRSKIGGDARIHVLPPIPSGEVITRLHEYDVVLVPSQWLETGPLVVLEAFAASTPVIGSKLGGIAELVTENIDGLLVEPAASSAAWADSLRRICADPEVLSSLRARILPPRHSRQAATEIIPVYEEVCNGRHANALNDQIEMRTAHGTGMKRLLRG